MPLTTHSPEIRELVAQVTENRINDGKRMGLTYPGWEKSHTAHAVDRRKYIAIDVDGSGLMLVDKAEGVVYGIRGYGQRGDRIGDIQRVTAQFRSANASFDPSARYAVKSRTGPMVTVDAALPDRPHSHPRFTLIQGGQPRQRGMGIKARAALRRQRRRG